MGEIEPKLKAIILGVPTLVLALAVSFWMSSSEELSWSIEGIALIVPVGLGIGWMILNLYNAVDAV